MHRYFRSKASVIATFGLQKIRGKRCFDENFQQDSNWLHHDDERLVNGVYLFNRTIQRAQVLCGFCTGSLGVNVQVASHTNNIVRVTKHYSNAIAMLPFHQKGNRDSRIPPVRILGAINLCGEKIILFLIFIGTFSLKFNLNFIYSLGLIGLFESSHLRKVASP